MDKSFSFHKLVHSLLNKVTPFDNSTYIKPMDSLRVYKQEEINNKYVHPLFSVNNSDFELDVDTPNVILISAAGATGKSELVKELSYEKQILSLDLGIHKPVGSNSLLGLLYNSFSVDGLTAFRQGIQNGEKVIIIDAFDEAKLKTKPDAFLAFLEDIYNIMSTSPYLSFILLGRPQTMAQLYSYFNSKGEKVLSVQISPFTEAQADEFIDKQLGLTSNTKYDKTYKDLKQLIIKSVDEFFVRQSDIVNVEGRFFLGYAPVLLAISELIRGEKNYKSLINSISKGNARRITLIVKITQMILNREQEKIKTNLLKSLLKGKPSDFAKKVNDTAYDEIEQCKRIVSYILDYKIESKYNEDPSFSLSYETQIKENLLDHPFLKGESIINVVFESYVIARLAIDGKTDEESKLLAEEYLESKYKNGYMLYFIYSELESKYIDINMIRFLYDSLYQLNADKAKVYMDIDNGDFDNQEEKSLVVDFEVIGSDGNKIEESSNSFVTSLGDNETLQLGATLSGVNVDVPLPVLLGSTTTSITAPASICCATLIVQTQILECTIPGEETIAINFKNVDVRYNKIGTNPNIILLGGNKEKLIIRSDERPPYPFSEYYKGGILQDVEPDVRDKYIKFRRTLLMFRSHSKGTMAKVKSKIDNRIGRKEYGGTVLSALLDKGILTEKGIMYYLNTDKLSEYFSVSFSDIRSYEYSDSIKSFLQSI